MKPIVFDFYCGLGGWSEAFIAEGYEAIGFDIEAHDYGKGGYPGKLILADVRTLNGAELVKAFGMPTCIVASSPCQKYSYMAMPWSKAKAMHKKILEDKTGKLRTELNELFEQPARIQREIYEATGIRVPMIQENVRGAQEWIGRSRWNFGSFHLWGDVPALMPIPSRIRKTSEGSWDVTRKNYNADHSWDCGLDGVKVGKGWLERDPVTGKRTCVGTRATGSKSKKRKEASAEIAKIPFALASWIAKTFKPES